VHTKGTPTKNMGGKVNRIRNTGSVGALCLGLALSGCATSPPADVPNAGAMLGVACGRVAIEATFRGGPVGLPVGLAVAGGCLPVALGVGILHAAAPHLALGAGGVPDTGPAELRNLTKFTGAERSVFPDSSPAGCSDCYASYRVADASPVEMRKLSSVERSVFPKPSPGCWYGYGC
jgi:hypothetical protein